MKKLLLAVAGLFLAINLHAQDLPKTQIKDLNSGKKLAFNDVVEKGKVTVISFWATWCIPCKKEIKNISAALPAWKKEADFNYVTVSIDEVRAEGIARTYAVSQGWTFSFYIDVNSDLKRSLNFQSVPFTVIIDKNGKIAFSHIGYEEGGEAEVFKKVKELAAAK
ncbi:thiol:disulfide interchange protein [Flavipsychrobacter stenotrophus]|uniref:Thiol:disulfide interchange protein n=1 Tax=Flavipsychrobacter stenotrophus TaxID=2077091 RepID=A0A2S7SXF8_9BACT|nr:TlpA disulfide reductase family protein [Flavipsychrobacter stenotrophus]PQJ11424.1 thiol:disulfide interchange protein [Flavipsychrobacter stenotrophus]